MGLGSLNHMYVHVNVYTVHVQLQYYVYDCTSSPYSILFHLYILSGSQYIVHGNTHVCTQTVYTTQHTCTIYESTIIDFWEDNETGEGNKTCLLAGFSFVTIAKMILLLGC